MNITTYIILGWLVFLAFVYGYMFYDIHAEQINIREKWNKLVNAFTEEE